MKTIKSKERLLELTDQLLLELDDPTEIGKAIDELIFDHLFHLLECDEGRCPDKTDGQIYYTAKKVRDFFYELQTIFK